MTALTLVSALALALVYGLGGVLAIGGHLQAGAIVALALLLTRLYAPLTALANARVEIVSALVSFERVFEVLDLSPLIREKPGRRPRARRRGVGGVRRRAVLLSVRRQGVAGLAGGGGGAGRPRRRRSAARHVVHRASRGRWSRWSARRERASPRSRRCWPGSTTSTRGAVRLGGVDVRDLTFASLSETVGMVTQDGHLFHESIRANLLLAAPDADRRRAVGRAASAPGSPTSSPTCPTGWTPWSASAATGCPAASASG